MSTTDVHTLSGAYVLHALDQREAAQFAKHLASCGSCAQEVAELAGAVTRLADDAWAIVPARLKGRLMARIRRVRQQPPLVSPSRPLAWQWLTRQWLLLPQPVAAAAIATVIFTGTGTTVAFGVQAHQARHELAAAQASAAQVQSVLTAADTRIQSSPVMGGGTLTVASSQQTQQTLIMLAAAAAPPDGRVYQLWTITNGAATSAGILRPGQHTATTLASTRPGTIIGVTIEPPAGSATPTFPIIAQTPAT